MKGAERSDRRLYRTWDIRSISAVARIPALFDKTSLGSSCGFDCGESRSVSPMTSYSTVATAMGASSSLVQSRE
jgi:hypothetical protein